MRICHTADIHLYLNQRHDEYRQVFKTFFKQLKSANIDRIVIAGDLVHSKTTMSPELISIMTFFLNGLRRVAPVDIIPGNHDLNLSNKDRMDALSPVIKENLQKHAGNLHPINYYTKTGLYEVPDSNIVYVVWSMMDGKRPVIVDKDPDKVYIGIFHGVVNGSSLDNNYSLADGDISVSDFDDCDIVMLGDIHKRQGFGGDTQVVIEEIVTETELKRLQDQSNISDLEVVSMLEHEKDV